MRAYRPHAAALLIAAVITGCTKPADTAAPGGTSGVATSGVATSGVAWKHATNDADIDAAFVQAKDSNLPVFVYWGAQWCPPCNLVKATVFNRQDFIERSRAFVPVYIDGDSPGAQKLGARFNVSGYPTMLLFSPQGAELTRLPGEIEPARYTEVLTLGMNAERPVKDVLASALHSGAPADGRRLNANDWRLLAFYSWDTDEGQLVPKDGVAALLGQLADACPAELNEIATRLRLKALAAADTKAVRSNPAQLSMLLELLADEHAAHAHIDVLTNYAAEITRAVSVSGTQERTELLGAFDAALKHIEAETTLSRADRLTALIAQVDLAGIDVPASDANAATPPKVELPQVLLTDIRKTTARLDHEITDDYERQAVIPAAADLLQQAGLGEAADALLEANLNKSHSPYYLMSGLANNAQARGDNVAALRWYEAAFNASEGPATRLQWGANYVNAVIELTPQDEARIEAAAARLLNEAAAQHDALYERSGRSLQKMGTALVGWNKDGSHSAAMQRLQQQIDAMCGALDAADPKRTTCTALLQTPRKNRA